jgi:membrane protein implicated in regulation of membrane protease activity
VALRNAAVLLITNLGFTIVLLLLLLIVAAISTAIPLLWFMVTVALFAVVCNRAVLHLLEPYRERARAEAEGEDETSGEGGPG